MTTEARKILDSTPSDDPAIDAEERTAAESALADLDTEAGRVALLRQARAATAKDLLAQAGVVSDDEPQGSNSSPETVLPSDPTPDALPTAQAPAQAPTPGEPEARMPLPKAANWLYRDRTPAQDDSLAQLARLYAAWLGATPALPAAPTAKDGGDQIVGRHIDPGQTCTGANLGTRAAPVTPTRPGTVYLPVTDTFVGLSSTNREVYHANPTARFQSRTVGGVEQFLVEANVNTDPSFHIGFFEPEITVSRIGAGVIATYTPNDADVDVLCYSNDAGSVFPTRGYVRAWLPATLLAEPGVQVGVQVTNRPFQHILFFGADLTSVHVGPRPLGRGEIVPNSVGLQVDDSVLVDRDNDPRNDVEGALVPRLTAGVAYKINTTAPVDVAPWWLYPLAHLHIGGSSTTRPVDGDLELVPAAAGDDERMLRVTVMPREVRHDGSFVALGTFCTFRHDWYGEAGVDVGVNIDAANARLLHPLARNDSASISTRRWTIKFPTSLHPLCHLWGLLARSLMKDDIAKKLKEGLKASFSPGPGSDFDQLLATLDLTTSMQNGISFPNGNGVAFPTDKGEGWMRTCAPRGCQGGDVSLMSEGLEGALALNTTDRKAPSNSSVRFPLTYQASGANATAETLLRRHVDSNGQPFSIGLLLNNGFINQLLRSVTEGSAGPDPTNPTLAPNGILDLETSVPALGWTIRTAPTVAPAQVATVVDPTDPSRWPLGIAVPDLRLRVNDGSGWGDPAIVGLNLAALVDVRSVTSQTIDPSIALRSDTHVLRCHSLIWLICASGGLVTTIIDGVVTAASNNLDASLTNIVVPDLSTQFFLGGVRLQKVDGDLALYANLYPKPKVTLSGWYDKPWYGFNAAAEFPPGPPVSYSWSVRDMLLPAPPGNTNPNFNVVWQGSTGTTNGITRNMAELFSIRTRKAGLFHHSRWWRQVQVTVTATQPGGLTASNTSTMDINTEIW